MTHSTKQLCNELRLVAGLEGLGGGEGRLKLLRLGELTREPLHRVAQISRPRDALDKALSSRRALEVALTAPRSLSAGHFFESPSSSPAPVHSPHTVWCTRA